MIWVEAFFGFLLNLQSSQALHLCSYGTLRVRIGILVSWSSGWVLLPSLCSQTHVHKPAVKFLHALSMVRPSPMLSWGKRISQGGNPHGSTPGHMAAGPESMQLRSLCWDPTRQRLVLGASRCPAQGAEDGLVAVLATLPAALLSGSLRLIGCMQDPWEGVSR